MGRITTVGLILLALCTLSLGLVGCGGGTDTGSAAGIVYRPVSGVGGLLVLAPGSDTPDGYTPAAGATVEIGGESVTTNADGSYFVGGIDIGCINIHVALSGFPTIDDTINIQPGETSLGYHDQGSV